MEYFLPNLVILMNFSNFWLAWCIHVQGELKTHILPVSNWTINALLKIPRISQRKLSPEKTRMSHCYFDFCKITVWIIRVTREQWRWRQQHRRSSVRVYSHQAKPKAKAKKIKEQTKRSKDKADKDQRKYSLSLSLSVGLNWPYR